MTPALTALPAARPLVGAPAADPLAPLAAPLDWLVAHGSRVWELTLAHVWLAGVPLLVGLLLAIPLGWWAHRSPRVRPVVVLGTGLLYTIPSLALFVLMPLILGTKILDPVNVVAAMTVYTLALLVRTVTDGLDAVPDDVRQAAVAMGLGRFARFARVELPLAVPVIAAGARVAAVSNVSIVSVASLIGVAQLGTLLTDGYQRAIWPELLVGIGACLLLALLFDVVIVAIAWLLTPWTHAPGGALGGAFGDRRAPRDRGGRRSRRGRGAESGGARLVDADEALEVEP